MYRRKAYYHLALIYKRWIYRIVVWMCLCDTTLIETSPFYCMLQTFFILRKRKSVQPLNSCIFFLYPVRGVFLLLSWFHSRIQQLPSYRPLGIDLTKVVLLTRSMRIFYIIIGYTNNISYLYGSHILKKAILFYINVCTLQIK